MRDRGRRRFPRSPAQLARARHQLRRLLLLPRREAAARLAACACQSLLLSVAARRWCPLDLPLASLPNGGGQLCYTDAANCTAGPNGCHRFVNTKIATSGSACTFEPAICATGKAGSSSSGLPYNYACLDDQPAGAQSYVYQLCCSSEQLCCVHSVHKSHVLNILLSHFCAGSLPSGSGALCYDTLTHCHEGANACGTNKGDTPCILDFGTCATGMVRIRSAPVGAASGSRLTLLKRCIDHE